MHHLAALTVAVLLITWIASTLVVLRICRRAPLDTELWAGGEPGVRLESDYQRGRRDRIA